MFSIYLQYTVIFTCFSEVIKICSKVTSINCSSGLLLSSAQDLGQTVSSVNSYCTIILEYLVVRDVNIISVKLRCLHLTFSSVILVRGVGGGWQAVQVGLSCPPPRIWVRHCHQSILIAPLSWNIYFSQTEMFTSNVQFGYPCPSVGGQAIQAGLSCPPPWIWVK